MLRWLVIYPALIALASFASIRGIVKPQRTAISAYALIQHNELQIRNAVGNEITSNIRYRAYFIPVESGPRRINGMRQYFGTRQYDNAVIYASAFIFLGNGRYYNIACWIQPDMSCFCALIWFDHNDNIGPNANRAAWAW